MTFNNSAPIYQQIVESFLNYIATGVLVPGQKIDSVRVLAAQFKVNPNTMQKSLEKLGDMGFVFSERTSGRFVTEDAGKIAALRDEMPTKMTNAYINEMLAFGIQKDEIVVYVKRNLTERNEKDNE